MSSSLKPTKARTLADVQALMAGTQKHLPNGSFTIGNTAYSAASLVALFQTLVDATAKQLAAKASVKDTASALTPVMLEVDPVVQGYKDILKVMFAGASQTLADFGIAPPKVRVPLTVEQLAARTAKLRATRKARGTLGPKAKKAIKGTVTPPTDQPVAAPPNPPKPAA